MPLTGERGISVSAGNLQKVLTDVLEESVFVGGGLDAAAHDEAADGEVVELWHDGQSPALGDLETQRPLD